MALGKADDNGTVVFVSSTTSVVTALIDRLDGSEVEACTLLSGQDNPNGIAYDATTGSLYVAEVRAITRYDNVDAAALAGCDASLLTSTQIAGPDVLPAQASHANRALGIGPTDGKLYFTVGAPFNVDVCVDPYCSIHRINKDGSGAEVFARGIRNAAGWDWHPGTGALLWAGMERDEMGNDLPDDILAASYPDQPAVNWAWPYCHWVGQGDPEQRKPGPGTLITDPDVFPTNGQGGRPSDQELLQRCQETAPPPVQALGPHVAPLGVLYWPAEDEVPAGASTGATQQQQEEWPEEYAGSVFVGEHGSWNRPGAPIGYRIANVQLSDNGTESEGHTVFAEGWLQPNGEAWGRPVGLLRLPDGSMLLADDKAGVVYRISYGGANAPTGSTGFKARWSLDVRFGSKSDAVALLQEWVATVGSAAGLAPDNTTLTTGSIGAPESTLELEVSFDSLAALEQFWSSIPAQEHVAWGKRMQQHIVHGSPQWHVYRCLPAFPAADPGAAAAAAAGTVGSSSSSSLLQMPSEAELLKYADRAGLPPAAPSTQQQTASGLSVVSGDDETQEVLDWKGDPMKINPGDKLPFKFF
ncbi:hypothetical protein D9Q98_005112 [Chlorella vulgaris]|uniref:Pyrroloquinoline quinone-dependent pyranose dehydrogenase beta-propeller domain-containing protein n=1 Tax=Chlorella vulgaris TaxID=3077 RepID=A0A9D4TPU9_CHLVU|nr:hypothetical protein D9Q98_005112 [Chlorella vulgaris]